MAFAWDIFAEEIGRVGERAAAGVRQRDINKRAEERALRMHEKRLQIEEPFKELESERILDRQKEIATERVELQKGLEEWRGELSRGLDIFAGSEGYQEAMKTARKEGGLSQVAVMRMEDSIMRARKGEVPDLSDFEGLPPFDRLKIMDLLKQNQMIMTETQQKQQKLDNEAMQLQSILQNREELARQREQMAGKRGLDIITKLDTGVRDAEEEFSKYRSELLEELTPKIIDTKGRLKIGGLVKKNPFLINFKTGDLDQEVLGMLLKKHPRYTFRFQRLLQLQANVMKGQAMRDQFTGAEPTEAEVPEEEIRAAMEMGLTREQAIEQYRKFLATKR